MRYFLGHHHTHNPRSDQGVRDRQLPQESEMDLNDQSTVFDGADNNNPDFDRITISTTTSESETIGDLRRQGFVNRCPRFNAIRTMPLTSIVLSKGFFCFPSEASFMKYLDNKRKFNELETTSGLGIPLYHALPLGVVKTLFSRNAPDIKIYKYVLINTEKEKPPIDGTFISQNGSFVLYKYLFCAVYQNILDDYSRIETRMEFYKQHETDPSIEAVRMANYVQRRNTDAKLNGLNLRWYGTTGFASPFGSGNLKLFVLDDKMPSFVDQQTRKEYDEYSAKYNGRRLGQMPIWALYSDSSSTVIPKRRTLRLATLEIGELKNNDAAFSEGILDIPWETEAVACMCMVLHEYESRKDKRTGKFGAPPAIGMQF
ncbi:hypothetical protein HG535_0G00390 [Zygotorulaspora mrakii]|uniref:Uncharacterized protein n=1 Tax=Zygotorulaspora mrakii TaxID=42260 RepID=A0A7H9B756_ZYGMR|nr:uncharacterized protein HG535_0G00390 [Zygotorulaspora mrakii]QLG74154.1 hypothetical protein HG535_0G00390 [Zygotorulaspora mrakii]